MLKTTGAAVFNEIKNSALIDITCFVFIAKLR